MVWITRVDSFWRITNMEITLPFQFRGFLSIWELNIFAATLDGASETTGELPDSKVLMVCRHQMKGELSALTLREVGD